MDLSPTFLELAGVEYPATHDGKPVVQQRGSSMVPFLSKNSSTIHVADEAIGWEYNDLKAVRVGDFKATYIGEPFGTDEWQIFDLSVDPGEVVDLSAEMPELKQRLITAWEEYAKSVGVVPLSVPVCPAIYRQIWIGQSKFA
ncbi:MAG: hypothetical protein ACU0CA_16965 [Paracoccaceae bacterium]